MATTTRQLVSLESGDRLCREEFHRRYCQRPDIKKAELVEGVVYEASPVRVATHGEPHGSIVAWLGLYQTRTTGVRMAVATTVRLDARNEMQPDACLWRDEPGRVQVREGYLEGAPQLVVEVAASSVSYDLHDKKEAYRRNDVEEYVVWRVLDGMLDWFRLDHSMGEYAPVAPNAHGVIESAVFPGLRLDVPKLLAGDIQGVLAALDQR